MLNVILLEKVKNDLQAIINFIWEDNPVYAIKTVDSIMNTIDILEKFPYVWKEISSNIRKIIESNYKYNIVYKIEWNNIYILSVYKYQNSWE